MRKLRIVSLSRLFFSLDVKPAGFKRLIHLIYNSRCLSWKMDDPEEWWHVLEAANKYINIRLVQQIERRLRDIARKEGGK